MDDTRSIRRTEKLRDRGELNSGLQCLVCGDKPTGVHYEVLSCNGCKSFFRRTIISGRSYKCYKGGKCDFNKEFRCACRSCRFDMCVNVGMNSKLTKKRKVHTVPRRQLAPSDGLLMVHDLLTDLIRRETITNELREKRTIHSDANLDDLLKMPCLLGTEQRQRLQVTDFLFYEWQGVLDEKFMHNPIRYWTIVDLRLTIEYGKSLHVFRELSNADQRALISHIGGVMVLLSQSFYSSRMKHGSLVYPDGTIAMKAVNCGRCSSAFQGDSLKWVYELLCLPVYALRDIGNDDNVFALLKAVAFLSPLDDHLSKSAKEVLQKERERCMDALSRLLLAKEGRSGPAKMAALLSALQTLFNINEKRRNHLLLHEVASNLDLSSIGREI